jgi:hypothetical protein
MALTPAISFHNRFMAFARRPSGRNGGGGAAARAIPFTQHLPGMASTAAALPGHTQAPTQILQILHTIGLCLSDLAIGHRLA